MSAAFPCGRGGGYEQDTAVWHSMAQHQHIPDIWKVGYRAPKQPVGCSLVSLVVHGFRSLRTLGSTTGSSRARHAIGVREYV